MIATRNTIHQWISTGAATAAIAIASLAFQASSIASPDAEALSAEARASLERQLAIAREERDALVLETEGQIAELTETMEAERADAAALRDQLATAESAQADAKAEIAELTEALEAERAETATLNDQLAAAESAQADAKTQIAELTETLEAERAQMATLREQLTTAESAQAEAKAQIAELTEALEAERAALEAQRRERAETKTANAEEREHLERQLAIAREERDALAIETEARIAELNTALETERAEQAQLRDALEAAESAHSQARAAAGQPVGGLGVSQVDATDLGGQLTENGILIEFAPDELRFDSATAVLPTTQLPTLDRVAEQLEDRPELSVIVQGHTDSLGSAQINQRLSQRRAEAVRRALIERGLDPERVAAEGAGSTQPIADNRTSEGQRRNRRVEIYLLSAQEDASNAE